MDATTSEADTPAVGVNNTPSVGDTPIVDVEELRQYDFTVGTPPSVDDPPTVTTGAWWVDSAGARYPSKRVQRVVLAQHSLSLGEERVYETLWNGRESDGVYQESQHSKTFSLGYDRIARLVRLNEKSVRMLLPKLLFKQTLEVVAAENSASRIGRTYRIFSYEEILHRQRASNLTHVAKNGRAVEFVWAVTTSVGDSTADAVRALVSRFDDHALRALWASCIHHAPDCTLAEVEYCLHLKTRQLLATGKAVIDPVGLMLRAVPKCFEGPAALHLAYRQQKRAEDELRRQAAEELSRPFPETERGREGKPGLLDGEFGPN